MMKALVMRHFLSNLESSLEVTLDTSPDQIEFSSLIFHFLHQQQQNDIFKEGKRAE